MDERMRILKMIEDKTITAEEADQLMKAMSADAGAEVVVSRSYDRRLLHIVVDSEAGDKVNIQFPVSAIKKILKATGKLPIPEAELKGLDLTALMDAVSECLDEEIQGDLVNVNAGDGSVVRIYVE